jgi:hypothetical protein
VFFAHYHLGIVVAKPVNLFGGPDNVPGTDRDTVVTGLAFIFINDYATGFTAFRGQQFSIPSFNALAKKDKQKKVYTGRNSLSRFHCF